MADKRKTLRRLVRQKKYDLALDAAKDILRTIPHDHDVNFIAGGIYHMQRRYSRAIPCFERSLEIGQYDIEVLLLKTDSHDKLGERGYCRACCQKILEIDPKNQAALDLLRAQG